MPHPFPHTYATKLQWTGEREGFVTSGAEVAPLLGGPPVQFDGTPRCWSPEALLISAVELCLMTTFLSIAQKKNLAIANYASQAEGVLDKTANGLEFTSIIVKVKIDTMDKEAAVQLLRKAKEHCIISNALKVKTELQIEVD